VTRGCITAAPAGPFCRILYVGTVAFIHSDYTLESSKDDTLPFRLRGEEKWQKTGQ